MVLIKIPCININAKQDFKEEDGRFYIPLPLFEFFLQANIRN